MRNPDGTNNRTDQPADENRRPLTEPSNARTQNESNPHLPRSRIPRPVFITSAHERSHTQSLAQSQNRASLTPLSQTERGSLGNTRLQNPPSQSRAANSQAGNAQVHTTVVDSQVVHIHANTVYLNAQNVYTNSVEPSQPRPANISIPRSRP
ncbi:hypothetical protein K505DRAFT_413531 [Melanomma pulvis-pyrius CBS 109.77]|uniref:Uncharacterized protein n=1 Tax=Melanomma pulvis-pyrius CBS 109.77 TaxID=1314802 RepID=A0A6A6XU02_9PLEO|nr:hypothetical protein K505DRAFT_413531 [Melanomma pulvis-pyrius CBS 109.77]